MSNPMNFQTQLQQLEHDCTLISDTQFDPDALRIACIAWLDNFREVTFAVNGTYTGEMSAGVEKLLREYELRYVSRAITEPDFLGSQYADRINTNIAHQKGRLLRLMYWAFRVCKARGEDFPLWRRENSYEIMKTRCRQSLKAQSYQKYLNG